MSFPKLPDGREQLPHYVTTESLDARYLVPDLDLECRRAVEDILLEVKPTTALGVLLAKQRKLVVESPYHSNWSEVSERLRQTAAIEALTVAGLINADYDQTRWVLDNLVKNGFAEKIEDDPDPILDRFMAQVTLSRLAPLPTPYPTSLGPEPQPLPAD